MRWIVRLLAGLIAFALVAPGLVVVSQPAVAQDRRPGLFQFLFGGGIQRREAPQATEPRVRQKPRRTRPAAPAAPPVPVVEKAEDAKVVLVVGDFMASGLAEGLREAYAERTDVIVVDRANGSSGFVRDDFYDWPAQIGSIVDEVKPQVVVAMIGSNDRQQMALESGRAEKLTDEWTKDYERRAQAFADAIEDRGLPLVWVGQPSFRVGSMSADMLAFNDLYRAASEAGGGEFVDVWDGFVDENGAFVTSGPDVSGQMVRLRGGDGINLTRAGKRKVAFYAEKPLARFLDDGVAATAPGLGAAAGEHFGPTAPDIGKIERTVPISLSAPEVDGETELLGAVLPAKREGEPELPGEKLTILGVAPPTRPGRADDFYGTPPEANEQQAEPSRPDAETTTAISP